MRIFKTFRQWFWNVPKVQITASELAMLVEILSNLNNTVEQNSYGTANMPQKLGSR